MLCMLVFFLIRSKVQVLANARRVQRVRMRALAGGAGRVALSLRVASAEARTGAQRGPLLVHGRSARGL